jgi:hypothetical protein
MTDIKRGLLAREGFTALQRAEAMGEASGEAPKRKRKRGA